MRYLHQICSVYSVVLKVFITLNLCISGALSVYNFKNLYISGTLPRYNFKNLLQRQLVRCLHQISSMYSVVIKGFVTLH